MKKCGGTLGLTFSAARPIAAASSRCSQSLRLSVLAILRFIAYTWQHQERGWRSAKRSLTGVHSHNQAADMPESSSVPCACLTDLCQALGELSLGFIRHLQAHSKGGQPREWGRRRRRRRWQRR